MSTSGKTGFYFRVLQEGYVDQDDDLELIQLADEELDFLYKSLMIFTIMIAKMYLD